MISDLGSLPNFGPNSLTGEDFQLLQDADYVCVFNWAATSHWGTELAERVFRHVKDQGKGKTYYDTADPTPNKENVPKLARKVLSKKLVNILGVNENEVYTYASHFSQKTKRIKPEPEHRELAKECARVLAKNLSARVDLHTSLFAGSFTKDNEVVVPAFNVSALRSTGAGDAWNAGNIFGDAIGLPDSCRLTMANAVAAYYISNPAAAHPTLLKLIEFCEKQKSS
jgi:sugar/nucleoside kinase (ribokinase family)